MDYDVIIIGSGLGGLECGFTLSKQGLKVCVLEQDSQIGGCLQSFRRKDTIFDTGFHYVGGLGKNESLYPFFHYFGLLDLPWKQLDNDAFDEIVIGEQSFYFANGHERFVDTLAQKFPHQRENLKRYASFLKNVGEHLMDSLRPKDADELYTTSLFARSAYEFLNETIDDPLLRKVLSGTSLKMELNADKLPLYVFAQINNSYIQSAWRLQGGGSQIANRLAQQITAMGGTVRTQAKVTQLIEAEGKLTAAEINGEEQLSARWFISDAHPAHTLTLIKESKCIRKIYRKRITELANTFGVFTANIQLKPDSMAYCNRNIYLHSETADLWHPQFADKPSSMLVSFQTPRDGQSYTSNIDLLVPMSWNDVERWKDTPRGRRGEDYVYMKNKKTEFCIDFAQKRLPELRDSIEHIYTSTPLSYQSYTSTINGSAYGIQKDFSQPMYTILTPRTPIPNLLLTGQNLNLHGVLGVSVTSFFTCAEIVGMEPLLTNISQ